MTTPRRLNAPVLWSQPRASLRTAQASHASDCADLSNDGATGHVGQRATVGRLGTSCVVHCFWHPVTTARFLEVAVTVAPQGTWAAPDDVTIALSINDGTTNVAATALTIPSPFRTGTNTHQPGNYLGRIGALRRVVGHLDRTALDATLNATVPWRLTFTLTIDATVAVDAIEVSEVARFAIDTAEAYGDIPSTYMPRGVITNALSRTLATQEVGFDLNRRTYLHLALDDAAPDEVTAAAWAAIPGSQSESAAVAIPWLVAPRRIDGTTPVLFGVRYRTSTATAGDVRITTAAGTYTLALPGTSGVWTDIFTGAATLADAATDTITWQAQVGAGNLKFATYWVCDAP